MKNCNSFTWPAFSIYVAIEQETHNSIIVPAAVPLLVVCTVIVAGLLVTTIKKKEAKSADVIK